jgi:hypothetical protein
MFFMTGLLNHLKRVQAYVVEAGGEASVDARDLSLEVTIGSQTRRFLPQFTQWRDGRRSYTPTFSAEVRAFIGWRPYAARRWAATAEKLAFKEYAQAADIRVPACWREPSADVRRFLVKQSQSSFGDKIRGPFERLDQANPHHALKQGDYYEAFVPGRIAKAWYLDGELVCLELRPPPFVVGDGHATILALAAKCNPLPIDEQALAWIVGAQGKRLDNVLEEGRRIVVDFKYASPFDSWTFDNENVLATVQDTDVGMQLKHAGRGLLTAIPPDMRHDTLITLDAVVDAEDRAWFLEMNSNPMVHPDIYPALLKSAFARPLELPLAS